MEKAQQRQSILFSLLISFVFILSPFYSQQSPGGEGLSIPYNSWVWIWAIMVMLAASFQILLKETIILPKFWLGIAALPLGLIFSGFIMESSKPTEWLFRIGYVLGGFLFFIALFQFELKRRAIENIGYGFCAAACLHSLIALSQISGWNISSLIPQSVSNAPISMFQQVNVLASYLTTGFFIALYLASSPSIKCRHWLYKLLLIITIVCTAAMLLSIGSRTSLVAFSVSLPLLLISRFSSFKQYPYWSILLLIAFISGIGAGANLSKGFATYESKLDVQRVNARSFIYDLSWQTFKQKPIFGHGLGSFEKVFQEAKIDYPDSDKMGGQRYGHPHNELLFWMIEGGVISLLGIIVAMAVTLAALFRLGWRRGISYFALLFPISFHTQVELPFYLSSALWFLWLTLLYIIHSHQLKSYSTTLSNAIQKLILSASVTTSCLIIGFLLHSMLSLSGLVNFIRDRSVGYSFIETANANIYFQDLAQNITFSSLLYQEIARGGKEFTPAFISWAENFVESSPITSTINNLALAYSHLGERDKALALMSKAIKMYPASSEIQLRYKEVTEGTVIINFRQRIGIPVNHSQAPATP